MYDCEELLDKNYRPFLPLFELAFASDLCGLLFCLTVQETHNSTSAVFRKQPAKLAQGNHLYKMQLKQLSSLYGKICFEAGLTLITLVLSSL